jgi:hypothetical protein
MPFVEWSCSYCTVDLISWSVHCTMNLQRPLPHEPTCSNWWGKSLVNVDSYSFEGLQGGGPATEMCCPQFARLGRTNFCGLTPRAPSWT